MFAGAYANQTVLVTGHTGFKGAWLSLWLQALGAHVIGYALTPLTDPNLFDACRLGGMVEDIRGDIRDRRRLTEVIMQYRPAFVFHLAAQSLVRESYAQPHETFDVNVMGTVSLLDAVRTAAHRCAIVVVSSDKCYANAEWEYGYRENDPLGGHDPYSASKGAMEIALGGYRSSFFPPTTVESHGVRVASARAGNVIGGGDWSTDRIVPDAIKALVGGAPIPVRHPNAIRPWQHVLEPLSGYLWLGARLCQTDGASFAAPWNFGPLPTDVQRVDTLIDAVITQWGSGSWYTPDEIRPLHEASVLRLSIDKASGALGWQPVWPFDVAVDHTIRWYRAFYQRPDDPEATYHLCIDDLTRYEHAARLLKRAWTT